MPTIGSQPTLRDTQAVGAALLQQFARERFIETGIENNSVYHSIVEGCDTQSLYRPQSSLNMASYGRKLRQIAEEFEKTQLRQDVKKWANKVQLNDIDKEGFLKLLEELFQGGITRVRIVILFFYCTDIALRATSLGQELVMKFMNWSYSYIINTVCKVVHELGGWDHILFRKVPSLLITCCAVLGVVALATYLCKNLRA